MVIPRPFVLSLSKDKDAALRWFDKLTTNGFGAVLARPFVLSLSKDGCAALWWFDKLTTNGFGWFSLARSS